jgi:hypothetical protein
MFKILYLLIVATYSFPSFAQNKPECRSPGSGYFQQKFSQVFKFSEGEARLKKIISFDKSYEEREEIKRIKHAASFRREDDRETLHNEVKEKFDRIIEQVDYTRPLKDFPSQNVVSTFQGTPSGNISMRMDNLPHEDLDVLYPEVLEKLGKSITISYLYPKDKFEYFVSYEGEEVSLDRAFIRIQKDFEIECERRLTVEDFNKSASGSYLGQMGFGRTRTRSGSGGSRGGSRQ